MQQLSGLDSTFVHLESATTPMHIGSLAIYDQSTAPGGRVTFKEILSFFEARLHKARVFRQRLAQVPMGLDNPYWIEDPDFDLEFHIRHIALPQPGDWRQLCIQTARLHARPLDMNKPLWEAWVIEGLDNVDGVPPGSFALVTKFHHAAIDGVSGAEIAMAFHDLTADAEPAPPEREWIPDREPTGVELLGRSAVSNAAIPLKLGRLIYQSAPQLGKLVGGLAKRELSTPNRAPRTRFNENVSAHRVFDGRTFELDEIRAMKSVVDGATVNDVVVSVCGGALRKYLEAKRELPDRSLVAMAPMSVRSRDQSRSAGNLVTAMNLPVRSDVADPLERLAAVHDESGDAKKLLATAGRGLSVEAAELIPAPAGTLLARLYARARLAERLPPIYNTVITNVPGANVPLYSMGSRMVANYGLGPCVHGVGLFQPVIGYHGRITISAIACREMMPDPAFYCECLQAAYDELKLAATGIAEKVRSAGTPKSKMAAAKAAPKKAAKKAAAKPAKAAPKTNGGAGASADP